MSTIGTVYLESVRKRFKDYKELAEKSFMQLNDEQLFYTHNEVSNSIAINIQHMSGNMRSRFTDMLSTDGEKEWRERDAEFEPTLLTREALMKAWDAGWATVFEALDQLHEDDLLRTIYIRKEGLTLIDAINRQLMHYPYHIGQIIYIAKMMKGANWQGLSIPKKMNR